MRSPREITFRLRQETANALLAVSSPNLKLTADTPLPLLPDPAAVGIAVRDSEYARDLIQIAEQVIQGRIPVFDKVVDYGSQVAWRRDSQSGVETPPAYFRRIPYLDPAAVGDHKIIWEVNRHQHLVLAAQAGVISGREEFSDYVFSQLEHWWSENPFEHGINWTSALEVAFRALSWVWIWHLTGGRMPEPSRRRFLAELYRHGLHLEYNLSIYFSPNTHLLGEAVALHAIGRLFPKFPRADRWRKIGADIVRAHMESSVKPDGSYFEQSTYYQVYAFDMFAFHAVLEKVPAAYLNGIARMAELLASVVNCAGDLPFLGDDDGGRFFHPYGPRSRFARASLAVASSLTGKSFFPVTQTDCNETAAWWLGADRCAVVHKAVPEPKSRAFRDTGIVVMRRGPMVALFDAGPFGMGSAGHSHSDTLSLVVSVGDRELLIDSGTFSYMDPDWRGAFRSSSAHNTIRIDRHDQGRTAAPFRWTEKPEVKLLEFIADEACDRAVATCEYQGFRHKRRVEFANNQFSVVDEIEGPAGGHEIEQFWHFAEAPIERSPGVWSLSGLAEFSAEGGVIEQGWRSKCFGSKEPAAVIVVCHRAKFPITLHASLRLNSLVSGAEGKLTGGARPISA